MKNVIQDSKRTAARGVWHRAGVALRQPAVHWLTVIAGLLFIGCQCAATDKGASQGKASTRAVPLPDVVEDVLGDTGRSGSLVYGWRCIASGNFRDPIRASPPDEGTPIQRLRIAFAGKPDLRVTEDPTGLVRVVGGTFKTDVLDLQIKRLVFHNEDDPMKAFASIMDSPEIEAYLRQNGIFLVPGSRSYFSPTKPSPHLDGTRENIRLSEALDLLSLTYSGVWVYQECSCPGGKRMVALHFSQ